MKQPADRNDRLTALGNQLIDIHMALREELSRLRDGVQAHFSGSGGRLLDLRTHCLTFCSALTGHHTDEDGGVFPALAEQFPQLQPVIEELERDHHVVAGILSSLPELLSRLGAQDDPAAARLVRAELDGLAAVLESHFVYEEKKLVDALNTSTTVVTLTSIT